MSRYVINILASRDLNDIADYFVSHSLDRAIVSSVPSTADAASLLLSLTVTKAMPQSAPVCGAFL